MVLRTQDARAGRTFADAFECWGNPPVGGAVGTFNASYVVPAVTQSCSSIVSGITNGQTLAQSLTNVDLEVIELGTNDESTPLGNLGDAVTAGTFYGNLRWVVETYLTAKPSLRVVLVTPQWNGFFSPTTTQQFALAMEQYGNSIGIPVINMFKLGGVNGITQSTLTRDGTHPSDFAFSNFYGPVIAQGLQKVF
jgi:hypothetical protein